jgi:putative restriction endonuclease
MSKAVFIASSHSAYDDRPGEVYHFPNMYLSRVAQTVGDRVILYQGRRGGLAGYYAVQRVERIVPDPVDTTHSYAVMDRSSLLSFDRPVPRFRPNGTPYETGLPVSLGSNTSSVRLISEVDYAAIIDEGLREDVTPETLPREGPLPRPSPVPGFAEGQAPFHPIGGSDREQVLSSRAFRDRAFARQVKTAYRARCAMSGLELRNGGGRPEVEAAHIVPVEARGPDVVSNGLALSGTVHWMFDRGPVAVDEDFSLLIARDSVAADIAERLFVPDRRLIRPDDPAKAPHPAYLKWHRDICFKG